MSGYFDRIRLKRKPFFTDQSAHLGRRDVSKEKKVRRRYEIRSKRTDFVPPSYSSFLIITSYLPSSKSITRKIGA